MVVLDFVDLSETIPIEQFKDTLHEDPTIILNVLAMAMHQVMPVRCVHAASTLTGSVVCGLLQALKVRGVNLGFDRVTIRMRNYSPITAFRGLKSNVVDKMVAIRGNVVRVSGIKPLVKELVFCCMKCGNRMRRAFLGTTDTVRTRFVQRSMIC